MKISEKKVIEVVSSAAGETHRNEHRSRRAWYIARSLQEELDALPADTFEKVREHTKGLEELLREMHESQRDLAESLFNASHEWQDAFYRDSERNENQ